METSPVECLNNIDSFKCFIEDCEKEAICNTEYIIIQGELMVESFIWGSIFKMLQLAMNSGSWSPHIAKVKKPTGLKYQNQFWLIFTLTWEGRETVLDWLWVGTWTTWHTLIYPSTPWNCSPITSFMLLISHPNNWCSTAVRAPMHLKSRAIQAAALCHLEYVGCSASTFCQPG